MVTIKSYTKQGNKRWKVDETWVNSYGKNIRLRRSGFVDKKSAQKYLKSRQRESDFIHQDRSVGDVLDLYLKNHNYKSRPSDICRAAHLKQYLGNHNVCTLSILQIDNYRHLRSSEGASPATQDREVELLCRSINYALNAGLVRHNPVKNIKLIKAPNCRDFHVKPTDVDRLIDSLVGYPRLAAKLARVTGMRLMETLTLEWNDVEFAQNMIIITIRASKCKTKSNRKIPVFDRDIINHFNCLYDYRCDFSKEKYVFAEDRQSHISSIRYQFEKARKKCGLNIWFHDLRRIFVTECRENGISDSVIKKYTGHISNSAFDRYCVVDPEELARLGKQASKSD